MNMHILVVAAIAAVCATLVAARPEPQPKHIPAEEDKLEKIQDLTGGAEQEDLKGASSYGYGYYGGYYPYYGDYYGAYPHYSGLGYYKLGYPYYGGYGLYGHHYY